MKFLFSVAKTATVCFLIYKSLFNAFLFLVAGMWIIPVLLLILFAYLCKSLFSECVKLNSFYKNFKRFNWKEKLQKLKFGVKTSKRFSSETV